jgi:hypothetical protein
MFKHGKEKEERGWVLGDDGFPVSFSKRFFQRVERVELEEEGNDKE